jgi:ATP-dependent Lon protease
MLVIWRGRVVVQDEKEPLIAKYKQRMSEKKIPDEAKKVIEEELSRMSGMDSHSMEFSMIRNYLDWLTVWLTVLPWG